MDVSDDHVNGDHGIDQIATSNDDLTFGTGAVQEPGASTIQDGSLSDAKPHDLDVIKEGKQKAQEVLAAANAAVSIKDTSIDGSEAPNATTNGSDGNAAPVSQLSRKRSRDGTQLPMTTAQEDSNGAVAPAKSNLHEEVMLDRFIQYDDHWASLGIQQEKRTSSLIHEKMSEAHFYEHTVFPRQIHQPGTIFGYGYMGYGNGYTEGKPGIITAAMRPAAKGRSTPQLRFNRKDTAKQADQMEQLVPVRLDIELDKLRLRDTFTWNLQERLISPALFTSYLLEDLRVPPEVVPEVARQVRFEIEDQTHNYYPHVIVEDGALEPGRPYTEYKDDEMRIQIKLHITIGRITLVDQFEWDINNPLNSPEDFAKQMAWENALSGEFTTAIAHSIREQSHQYTKSLWLTNHVFDGRPVEDPDVRDSFLPAPIHSSFRPQQSQKDWMPYMYEMSEAELDRTETIMMREHRAQKRQLNRRGGPALPDLKERQRTVRSLFVHTVIPGAVETWDTTGMSKTRRSGRVGRRPGARAGDEELDSSDLESDDDTPESPLPSTLNASSGGTARTRGMRGAASAAQAAMRANYNRSVTPDMFLATPQESRSHTRRSMLREESVADDDDVNDKGDRLIVKLRLSKARFRAWWDEYRAKKRASEFPLSGYASAPGIQQTAQPSYSSTTKKELGTPSFSSRILPGREPRTPQANGSSSLSPTKAAAVDYDSKGRHQVDHWPNGDAQPPPPAPDWLQIGIKNMRERHPDSDFEPLMRPYCISETTDTVHRPDPPLEPGASPEPGIKIMYLPKIRCNDCPGKVYTTIPGKVEEDFEVHLRNRTHRERVAERVAKKKRGR